jgi:peptidyl-dipeptidase Dcp
VRQGFACRIIEKKGLNLQIVFLKLFFPTPVKMNRLIKIFCTMFILTLTACQSENNPLLLPFNTPFETPPFHKIRHEHYVPAFKAGMEAEQREIQALVANPAPADFENTIEALARSGQVLGRVSRIFYPLNNAETDPGMQEIAREVAPLLSDHRNDILFNESLFARVQAVYEQRDSLELTPEQATLLERTYLSFARNGASLQGEARERLREISRELSELSLKFSDNVLAETNAFVLHITDENDLSGLPESQVEAAAQAAQSREMQGWVFTLHAPSLFPFLQYADNRELRRKIFTAMSRRGYQGNEYDNRENVERIVNLRLERAMLLGYSSHADFVLVERMAENADNVNRFLDELLQASYPAAQKELEAVQAHAQKTGADFQLMPWDWSYYAEKLRKARYDLDQELLRPYFRLEDVKQGIFGLTHHLWGLSYRENQEIPVYHPDVKAYEVYDAQERFLAVLYLDFFPREGKSGGAWMTSYRSQEKVNGMDVRPLISVVCNFSKPTPTRPSLLTFNEFNTFLHEFGHALHGIFSDVTYPGLSGTSVYRDFVELPSQIMENWALERGFLDMFARHYETGEGIPGELVDRIIASKNYNAAYAMVRQLSFALADMGWHSITRPLEEPVDVFEARAMEPAQLFPRLENSMMGTYFEHIFAGGYAAGYYSYKWAEVLDADAYQVFRENGIFDKTTAEAFRSHILSKGGSEHPMVLYKRFRGSEPTIDALLERDGLK